MKKIYLLLSFLLVSTCNQVALAQFLPQSQMGLFNMPLLNPAAMGTRQEKLYAAFS
ncbi:MAG: hypothetical protein ACOVQA_05825, partial [Thermoflexibacteraceae bacterium]